eukprot:9496403-Pyramimonas_sp.AAC.1
MFFWTLFGRWVRRYSSAQNYWDPNNYRSDKVRNFLAALPPPPSTPQFRLTASGRQVRGQTNTQIPHSIERSKGERRQN